MREERLGAALEAWRYFAEGARFIFGSVAKCDPDADKVVEAIRETKGRGLTRQEIYSDVFQGNKKTGEIARLMQGLQKQGRARTQKDPASAKRGPRAERWLEA